MGSALRQPGGKRRWPGTRAYEHKILARLQLRLPEFAFLVGLHAAIGFASSLAIFNALPKYLHRQVSQ